MNRTVSLVERATCPHCKKLEDLTEIVEQLDEDHTAIECGHCGRNYKVVAVQQAVLVTLEAV